MLGVLVRARCFPTEDRIKVSRAISNLFPDAVIEGEDPISAHSQSIEFFADTLRRQRIRDAARRMMRRGIDGDSTRFMLNKQVAFVGKISFSEESHALGDLEVIITSDDIGALIDSIAPSTRTGGVR